MAKNTIRMISLTLLAAVMALSGCDTITGPGLLTTAAATSVAPQTDQPATATPTVSDEPTASATPSPTPSASPSPSPTATPEASPTATGTVASETATATASADASAQPTATPTAAPTTPLGDRPDVSVVEYYRSQLPDGLKVSLQYKKYDAPYHYFLVRKSTSVRELPNAKATSMLKVGSGRRLALLAKVKGADGKSTWYRVQLSATKVGYVIESAGIVREFRLQQALERANAMKAAADSGTTLYVSNYKNSHGLPPKQPNGKAVDARGYRRDQSAPGYLHPDGTGPISYIPDGTLMQLMMEVGDYALVYLPYSGENFYVPKKYVNLKADHIGALTQAVIVDRKNQNVVVLEYAEGGWRIVSLSYVSTGKTGGSSMPTPLGAYATLGKASKFFYYGDGDSKLYAGFAPYAVRFTGGVWLHGVPHDIPADPETGKVPIPKTYRESNSTLGTTPQSHGCVRNYTSHALFLYNWLKVGSSAVAVID